MKTAAVILAAGLSRRMGKIDKLKLSVDDMPMAEHCIRLAQQSGLFSQIIVVANQPDLMETAQRYKTEVISNPIAWQGMGTSVAAGSAAVHDTIDFVMYLTADQPFLTQEILETLIQTAQQTDLIVVPRVHDRPKSPCIFPKRFLGECKTLSGETGGKGVYRKHMDEVVWKEFPDGIAWKDIDTMQDYNALIQGDCAVRQDAAHGMP